MARNYQSRLTSQSAVTLLVSGIHTILLFEVGVTNAANLSLFMVSLSLHLLQDFQHANQELSILDLKVGFRGFKYVQEVVKLLPQKTAPILLASIFAKVVNFANFGAIHHILSFADTL